MCAALSKLVSKQAVASTEIPDDTDSNGIDTGTEVLLKTMIPPGVSAKLYTPWKRGFVVRKRCDKYTYIVTPIEAPRRRFLVHRNRIRILHRNLKNSPKVK